MDQTFAFTRAADAQRLDFDWGYLLWYASGPQNSSDHVTVGRCVLKPGCTNPKHYHPNCEEVLHVLSGRIEHFVEGSGWIEMCAGDTITIAQDTWHNARNVGEDDAHLLICFSSKNRQTIGEDNAASTQPGKATHG